MRTASCILLIITALLCVTACSKNTKGSESAAVPSASPVKLPDPVPDPGSLHETSRSAALPAGTVVPVEIGEVIDSETVGTAIFFIARVADNVAGPDGGVAIPAEASALIVVRTSERTGPQIRMTLGLNRIGFGDKSYKAENGTKDVATLRFEDDASKAGGHRSIHLQKGTLLKFKLAETVNLH